jgi:hypothetical protein
MFCAPRLNFGGTEGVGSRFHVLRSRTHFWRYRGLRVPFSCSALPDIFRRCRVRRIPFSYFALADTFSPVPRVPGPVFMFCAPVVISHVIEGVGSRFLFFLPELIFGGTEGVDSHFHVLRSRRRFPHYRGRRVPFSCFALPDSFSAIPRASVLVFIFCTPGRVFGGTKGVRSRYHVLRAWTHFRRYRGRRLPF